MESFIFKTIATPINYRYSNILKIVSVPITVDRMVIDSVKKRILCHSVSKAHLMRINKIPSVIPSGYFFLCNNGELYKSIQAI